MAKPTILGVEGYAAQFLREADAGICIEPENADQLAELAKRYYNEHFGLDRSVARIADILQRATIKPSASVTQSRS